MTIHQEIRIKARPEAIFRALTSESEFSKFSGYPAEFDTGDEGAFACFSGQITGRIIEKIENKMLAQEWRVEIWPEGIHSTVSFTLDQDGDETIITLDHSGYPEDAARHLDAGWYNMYWDPLKQYLEK